MKESKLYSLLIIFGAFTLLFRTIRLLIFEDGLIILEIWVKILTIIEMIFDILCLFFSFKWLIKEGSNNRDYSLKFGVIITLFHAFRVLIFVIGRIGPWKDFDKIPEYRFTDDSNLFWVYFASILSISGVIGVFLIKLNLRKQSMNLTNTEII